MARVHVNNYSSTLNGSITDVATSAVVTSATGLPTLSGSDFYHLTLVNGATVEIVQVTARTGTTLTIVRAQEGTTGVAWADLSTVSLRATANSVDRKQDQTATAGDVIDFGDATSLEIPNSATPSVTVDGQLALDTTITDHKGLLKYYSGEEMVIPALPIANLISTDAYVVTYDAATDSFQMAAGGGGGGGGLDAYTTTATAAGTTTLTVSSNYQQYFTGTTTQTVTMPVASTLVLGQSFRIVNSSTGIVTVQSSGANTVIAMPTLTECIITCILTSGTDAASWHYQLQTISSTVTGTGSLVRATSPTLVTPVLGTPTSGNITNCTGGAANYINVNTATAQSITAATYTKVQYDTEVADTDSTFDSTTNYRHTPTTAGKYLYIASSSANSVATDKRVLTNIYKNGAEVVAQVSFRSDGGGPHYAQTSAILDMNGSSDYVEVFVWTDATTTLFASAARNYLLGIRII